ncbi:MAG TPA: hypothetical protein VJW77_16480 [Terriglobia bacterium]|nr:hypothetical protein [Terriglobia bacterium]
MKNHKKVISFPSGHWRYFDYVPGARNEIEDWYRGLSEDAQDLLASLLKTNQKVDSPINWVGLRFLKGKYKEERLWELRFFADNRQQRLIGTFGNNRKEAIFLIGCYHKEGDYHPRNCLDTALRLAKAAKKGGNTCERKVEQDL